MWLADVVGELERERAMRVYVFPRLKEAGKLTEAEATLRLARLGEAITVLNALRDMGIHQTAQVGAILERQSKALLLGEDTSLPIRIKGGEQ